MKKSLTYLILLYLILNIFIIPLTYAQEKIPSEIIPSLPGLSREIDKSTGLPSELARFREIGNNLSEEESRKAYLEQEWTKILAKNKVLGPTLFYTNKFFSFFNPLWEYIFGVRFSWSWAFFIALLLWTSIIIIIYKATINMTTFNEIGTMIISIIVASLAANFGMKTALKLLTGLFINKVFVWIFFITTIILLVVYSYIMKEYGKKLKQGKKQETEQRREHKQKLLETITNIRLKGAGVKK